MNRNRTAYIILTLFVTFLLFGCKTNDIPS